MENRKPKILITYIEAGMGHITSAKAISDSLHSRYGDKLEILDDYFCRDSGDKVLADFERRMVKNVKAYSANRANSNFQFALLGIFGNRIAKFGIYDIIYARYKRAALRYFAKVKPDVIVSTHFFVSAWAAAYRNKYAPECKVITYNPDYNTIGVWGRGEDLFIVNNPLAVRDCIRLKIRPETIREIPFITRDDIKKCNLTKAEARAKHGLPADKFTVVLVNGAYGGGKMAEFTDELIKTDREMTVLVGACKNKDLFARYTDMAAKMPKNITLIPLEFRLDIHELYRAADVVITKTGATVVLDCLYMRTPIIVNYCAQPVEKFTRDLFINEYKVGEYIDDPIQCRARMEEFADNPGLLDPYRENTRKIDKDSDGGAAVADLIFGAVS